MNISPTFALIFLATFIVWFIWDFRDSARKGSNGFVMLWDSWHGRKPRLRLKDEDGKEFTLIPCSGCSLRLRLGGKFINCPQCGTPVPTR